MTVAGFGHTYEVHLPDGKVVPWSSLGDVKKPGELITVARAKWRVLRVELREDGADYDLYVEAA